MRLPGLFGVLVGTIVSIKEVFVAGGAPDRLNVHLVCHTHDDPGWLKTVDQYYYGANNTIAHAGVQYILDSVVDALDANPSRKFIYAEQAFMWRWWRRQGNERRKQVRRLVKEGRLSFVNGGWVMHDEATAHFVGMVDQTHLGHAFLRRLFGEEALPRVAWQIDPFGHSSTQASLLGAQAGFEALYFGRIDYQDSEKRIAESDMEMVWRASRSFEEGAQIFTGVFHSGNYGPPVGFCFDQVCRDEPIMDDPIMADYNVERRASEFADACEELGRHTRGNDVMLQMGGDFAFENANAWFKNLDKLVEAVNNEGRVHVFYSTPAQYTRAKHRSSLEWTVKEDDFFPYADCPDCYWTGFYSSRPGLKRLERVTSGYLQAARQLHALAGARGFDEHWKAVVALEQAQALIQHHDAVTGTSKQHVAEDYAQRLDKARVMAEGAVSSWLSRLAFGGGRAGISPQEDALPELVQCRFANVSVCDVTTKAESGFEAVIYNPMAQTRSGFIDIPVSWSEISGVHDEQGRPIDWQILPYHTRSSVGERRAMKGVLSTANRGSYTLVVPVDAAPLGLEHFHVAAPAADRDGSKTEAGSEEVGSKVDEEHGSGESEGTERDVVKGAKESTFSWARGRENLANGIEGETPESERRLRAEGRAKSTMSGSEGGGEEPAVEDVTLSNGLISVTFDGASGRIKGVDNLEEGVGGSLDIDQGWFFYPTFDDRQIAKGAGANGGTDVGDDRSGEVPGEHVGSAGAGASRVHQGLPEKLTRSRGQPGGAYIFRPNDSYGRARPVGLAKSTQGKMGKEYEYDESGLILKDWWVSAEGPLVWEVHQVFSDWISQSVRLRRGSSHVELEWSVGPVPVGDDRGANDGKGGKYDNGDDDDDDNDAAAVGKEVISRFAASALSSEGVFYTDANGREFQKRKRDHRPTWDINVTQPVAGNYYPITAATFIRDERDAPDSMQLSVLTDRAQGCASLADGELELLAHRRLLSEDQRGVGEALNETDGGMSHYPDWQRSGEGEVFRGTHYLIVSKTSSAMKAVRGLMDQVFSPFVAAFAERSDTGDGAKSVGVDDMSRHIENAGSSLQDFSPGGSGIDANELDVGLDHGLVRELGENVGLMTLMRLPPRRERDGAAAEIDKRMPLLVRLAHRFAPGEDSALSQPATVDLSRLLSGHSLVYAEEIALTGGASLAARRQMLRWETEEQGRTQSMSSHTEASTLGDGTVVHSETGAAATAIFDAGADGDGGGDGDDIYDDDDEEEDDDASLLTVWESSREGGRRHGAREAKAEGVLVCDLRRTGQSEAFKKRQCLTVLAPMEIKTFRLLVVPETV